MMTRCPELRCFRRPRAVSVVVLFTLSLMASPLHARSATRQVGLPVPEQSFSASRFHFAPAAAQQLHSLWDASTAAKEERVACLGGYVVDGVWQLTQIEPLETVADSLGVSAGESIELCGPPRWVGTVHTHIAVGDGGHRYVTFSGADRDIMRLWSRRWGMRGVFCVLHSDHDAHCEDDDWLIAGPETSATY
jgi:hypothetical protein